MTNYKSFAISNEVQITMEVAQYQNTSSDNNNENPIKLFNVKFPIGWKIAENNEDIIDIDDINVINDLNYILVKNNEINGVSLAVNSNLDSNSFKLSNDFLTNATIGDYVALRSEVRTWNGIEFNPDNSSSLEKNILSNLLNNDNSSIANGTLIGIMYLDISLNIDSNNIVGTFDKIKMFDVADSINPNHIFVGFPFGDNYLKKIRIGFNLVMNNNQLIDINDDENNIQQGSLDLSSLSNDGSVSYDVKVKEWFESNTRLEPTISDPTLNTVRNDRKWEPSEFSLTTRFDFPDSYEPFYQTNDGTFAVNVENLAVKVENDDGVVVVTNDDGGLSPVPIGYRETTDDVTTVASNDIEITTMLGELYVVDYVSLLTQEININFSLVGTIVVDNSRRNYNMGISRNYSNITINKNVRILPPIHNFSLVLIILVFFLLSLVGSLIMYRLR